MESPSKRLRLSPDAAVPGDNFLAFDSGEARDSSRQYGFDRVESHTQQFSTYTPREPRSMQHAPDRHRRDPRNDPRHAKDRPKFSQKLPGHEPWILVKTKYNRRFVHNPVTKVSLWRIPDDVLPGIDALEQQEEKETNARWAEEQLTQIRGVGKDTKSNDTAIGDGRNRRRRSESLQREDEEAMMAELAAEAERREEEDAKNTVAAVDTVVEQHDGKAGYGSDSSYEEVEVTDSEGEEEGDAQSKRPPNAETEQPEDEHVEFGEDDIAFQLAAMEEEQDETQEDDLDQDAEADSEEAISDFRDLLTEHNISPFVPWENIISDTSDTSILYDDRYTALPTTRARKEVWQGWIRDTVAELNHQRAQTEKQDPRIPYLAFLADKASPKLYWPEFKRKFKREGIMSDRKLGDKEREKLYRQHITRLKLPESSRKADLLTLLQSVPSSALDRNTSIDALPSEVLSHLHYISLPASVRDDVVKKYIIALPAAGTGSTSADTKEAEAKQRRQHEALAARQRDVDEARRRAEKEARWAKRDLQEQENEIRRAMDVN